MRRYHVDAEGWLSQVRHQNSPNQDPRPDWVRAPWLIVMHAISLPPGEFGGRDISRLFLNQLDTSVNPVYESLRGLTVSAHFLIERTGALTQFVSTEQRAWHAGLSQWNGQAHCNDFSIGIELEGTDQLPFEEPQYLTLNDLLAELCVRYPIRALTGHSDIAPGRKTDPGPYFDWERCQRLGYPVHAATPRLMTQDRMSPLQKGR